MQTFMPHEDFSLSAQVLDRQRLGKQRVEAFQILMALERGSGGWINHPAVKMWRGHEKVLRNYGCCMCVEWKKRGYVDNLLPRFLTLGEVSVEDRPEWVGDDNFHSSHRAALLFKNPQHYLQFGWSEEPKIAYVWPVR